MSGTNGVNGASGTSSSSKLLWKHPSPQSTPMYRFLESVNKTHNLHLLDYSQLHQWSINYVDAFWKSTWDFVGIRHNGTPSSVSRCNPKRISISSPIARQWIQMLPCFHDHLSSRDQH